MIELAAASSGPSPARLIGVGSGAWVRPRPAAGACHDGPVSDDGDPQGPSYVRCDPPVPVEVLHDDDRWYRGEALAYVGRRVTVRYTVDVGATHHLVVDADRVRRV